MGARKRFSRSGPVSHESGGRVSGSGATDPSPSRRSRHRRDRLVCRWAEPALPSGPRRRSLGSLIESSGEIGSAGHVRALRLPRRRCRPRVCEARTPSNQVWGGGGRAFRSGCPATRESGGGELAPAGPTERRRPERSGHLRAGAPAIEEDADDLLGEDCRAISWRGEARSRR
jgi:hypothetical protein